MSNQDFAVQLYSLRDACAQDFPATLRKVADIGFKAVEFAGYHGHSAKEIRQILDDCGLVSAGTHTSLDSVSDDNLKATAEFNAELGCSFLVVPYVSPEQFGGRSGMMRLAEKLTQASRTAAEYGARVGYHNHAWEFQTEHGDGEIPMELLAINTPPEVILQVDTGNAKDGGGDPIEFIEKWQKRVVTVHLKPSSKDFARYFIGEDDTDWKAVFAALDMNVTQHIIVEQERYPEPLSPAECVARDLKFLQGMGS